MKIKINPVPNPVKADGSQVIFDESQITSSNRRSDYRLLNKQYVTAIAAASSDCQRLGDESSSSEFPHVIVSTTEEEEHSPQCLCPSQFSW